MAKIQMISVGPKFVGQTKMWTLMNKNREMINIAYRPFMDTVFPKGRAVPINYEKTEKGRVAYTLDMKAVYEEIYEEDCEYDFKCVAQLTDPKTFRKYLQLTDDYGFSYKLYSTVKQDIKCIGGVITCKVVSIDAGGLQLESIHKLEEIVTRATEGQIKLFNKLHDSRVDDFKVFNKKSYRGYFNSLKDKYPDSAHFIYELLQNADDAKATSVSILLNHDSLIFKHNGTVHFSISDVDLEADDDYDKKKGHINSITGIGDSSKLGDEKENKIGKFGVGFKSVFQYTDAPEIYDDFFHFRIVNYIIPEALDHDNDQRDDGETLIYIPFLDPEAAYDDIIKKLRKLANATLFLNHMKNISWEDITTKESKKYFKIPQKSFKKGDIQATKYLVSEYDSSRYLWMFTRGIPIEGSGTHNIRAGVYLTDDGMIDLEQEPDVFCFFPTSESFQTCFLTHAPFILTEDRQHLLPGKKENDILVKALGLLVADALPLLRDIGIEEGKNLINENIYQFTFVKESYDEYEYRWDDRIIKPEFLKIPCRAKLMEEPLLLSRSGKYLIPEQAFRYYPVKIAELIDAKQLGLLTGMANCDFVSPDLNKVASTYFWERLKVSSFGLNTMARDISADYMKSQNPAWITKFFRFIVDEADKDFWKPDRESPVLLDAPIIKTTDGRWVPPFNNGSINVFYSSEESKDYNTVSDEMISSAPISKFLDEIGCKKPDEKDFILGKLLPKYDDDNKITDGIISQDFLFIYDYCRKCNAETREDLIERVSASLPIKCKSGDRYFMLSASSIYFDSPELMEYYSWKDNAYFLDSECYSPVINKIGKDVFAGFIKELGVRFKPEIIESSSCYSSSLTEHQKKQLDFDNTQKTYYRFIENTLDGLDEVLKRPITKVISKAIWKWLCESDLEDISKLEFRYQYHKYFSKTCDSCTIEKLRNTKWLFNSKGELKRPSEISIDEFSRLKYADCNALCALLGIVSNRKTLADLGASKEQQDTYDFGKRMKDKMREAGISESSIDEFIKGEKAKKIAEEAKKTKASAEQPSDFLERKEMSQEGKEMFSGNEREKTKELETSNISIDLEAKQEQARQKIQEQHDKAIRDLERDTELEEMKSGISDPDLKYSKKWFETLLKLEYLESPKNDVANSRTVSITFTTVRKEVGSERIIVLKNPSRSIPIELEDIGGLEVRFQFLDRDEFTRGFEVASVRDFTLRLKAPMAEADFLSEIDWSKCTRAFVEAHNPVELTGKFIDAFSNLYFDDSYLYDDEEGDEEEKNPNLKELLIDKDNIRFIYGPPGTGKTTALAEEIINLIQDANNKWAKILVLAPTNRACDEVALKIKEKVANPKWAKRFVATDSEEIEELGMVCGRDSRLYNEDKCCIISTMARLPYYGFRNTDDGAMKLKDIAWDYIYVDEASMVSLAHSVFTIYQFPDSQIIFAGDPNQIPPIVHEEEWQGENIYTMVGLSSFDNPVTEPIQFEVKKLMTQYRSVPAIGEVFSRYSYDGKIIHHRRAEDQQKIELSGYPIKTINLIPFKVERYDNIFGARKLAGSPVHLYSVILSVELCKYIAKEYNKANKSELTVGIICPYASEAQMIDKLVEQQRDIPDNIKITVGTIHGFQGAQCDIVFVVLNPPTGLAGIRGEDMKRRIFLNRSNIINVGISRAKDYMFILLPHSDTDGYENLTEIDRLGSIIYSCAEDEVSNFTCDQVEKFIFGKKFFIENNMFATSHQLANVYTKPEKQYEIRIDDNAVDIQIG